jgi:hypothetical protein
MTTIDLPYRLIDSLKQLANQRGSSVEGIVEDALTGYLHEQRHQRLLQEMERFREQHQQLKEQYLGQYIGMYDGRILDHDTSGGQLYTRLRERYGDLPILVVEVTGTPEQEFLRLHHRVIT